MNAWQLIVIVTAVLVSLVVGFIVLLWIAKSIGTLVSNSTRNGWQPDDVIRLVKKVVLLSPAILLLSLLPWSMLFTTFGVMADQYLRNLVNRWTSGPELFEHLAIDVDEYYSLPLHWRQALAEIAFREDDEDAALKQFISRLDMRDIEILELVAKYAVSGGLLDLRQSAADGNPAREIKTMDIIHLQAIGIIDSQLPLNHRTIPTEVDATVLNWLVGQRYALHLRSPPNSNSVRLSFRVVTETGMELVEALRRPTSISYLCWLQSHYSERGLVAEIWSTISKELEQGFEHFPVSELPEVCSTIDFTTEKQFGQAG